MKNLGQFLKSFYKYLEDSEGMTIEKLKEELREFGYDSDKMVDDLIKRIEEIKKEAKTNERKSS